MTPADRRYSKWHTWARPEGGAVAVGITDFAQRQLKDIVALELPRAGASVVQGKAAGCVESVKTVHDIVSPVSGTVTAVNAALETKPDLLNGDPYGTWIYKVAPSSVAELDGLMEAAAYDAAAPKTAH